MPPAKDCCGVSMNEAKVGEEQDGRQAVNSGGVAVEWRRLETYGGERGGGRGRTRSVAGEAQCK